MYIQPESLAECVAVLPSDSDYTSILFNVQSVRMVIVKRPHTFYYSLDAFSYFRWKKKTLLCGRTEKTNIVRIF